MPELLEDHLDTQITLLRSKSSQKWKNLGNDVNDSAIYAFLAKEIDSDDNILELQTKYDLYTKAMEEIEKKENFTLEEILEQHTDPNTNFFEMTFPTIPIPNKRSPPCMQQQ